LAADATTTITRFNEALLAAMRSSGQTTFSRRFQVLAPAVDQTFDLRAVLAISVGPSWANLSPDLQGRLLDAFRRYTVASYVANFDSYDGQRLTVSPNTRSLDAGRVVVESSFEPRRGDATEFGYVMQQTSSGWKVVDVLATGSISRVGAVSGPRQFVSSISLHSGFQAPSDVGAEVAVVGEGACAIWQQQRAFAVPGHHL
jgi:phospholipid transport system substrate-binding protein